MRLLISTVILFTSVIAFAQDSLDTKRLDEVIITGYRTLNGIGHFESNQGQVIYAGKKTEVILVDSLDANKAINNTRQILGRIPGLNIVESETGGFVANGFGIRGLNPVQSLEMNVRQNDYNIAADVFGYNETYYLPPMEAVGRIELIKGAAALQFGPQFGGMVNYHINEAPKGKKVVFTTSQTTGSFGLFNSYNQLAGTINKFSYQGFIQYRTMDGWRPNSEQQQITGFGKITYAVNKKLSFGLEYSILRNKIKMPGGLTDEQFNENSRSSFRTRNWLSSPWNIFSASMKYVPSERSSLSVKATYLSGERNLVWFQKGPDESDLPDPGTGVYVDREVEQEFMKNFTAEVRYLTKYDLSGRQSTLAAGVRFSSSEFERLEEGRGTNGSDFDLSVANGMYEEELEYTTLNIAPFIENSFQLTNSISVTPGIRFEYIYSTVLGEVEDENSGAEAFTEDSKRRVFLLFGTGIEYEATNGTSVYLNFSQAYRPIDYAQLTPLGVSSVVDPDMKDARGFTADVGYRGSISNVVNFDVGLFYLAYNDRPGLVLRTDPGGATYTLRTNVANSVHKGFEGYVEFNILAMLNPATHSKLNIFNSLSWMDARYTKGEFKGNAVEYAPDLIDRLGLVLKLKAFSSSIQWSHQSRAFGDANNTPFSDNALVGIIPGYNVLDWSVSLRWQNVELKGGINNIGDARYFTQRTDEYPGPGIIPSIGRSFYVGLRATIFGK